MHVGVDLHPLFLRQILTATQADLELTQQPMLALDSLLFSYLSLLSVGITGMSHSTRL